MKCQACGVDIRWAVNLDSNKRVPLVPFDPAYPKAVRYSLGSDTRYCKRDNEGEFMSHFANCTAPKRFSGRNK